MAAVGEAKGLICEGVDGVVDAVEAEIRSLRRRGPRLVILYDRADEPTYERLLADRVVRGHTHNSGRRSLEVLARVDVADPLRYLFVNTGIGDRALEPFAVLCFQRDAILQVPRTGARRCLIVLTRSVLNEFRRRPLGVFDQLWGFQQRTGFQVMKQFRRNALVLLGEKVRWPDALAFPDMRALPDGGERRRMLNDLLAWGQQQPCVNCGAVLPRWANRNLCCRGLEAQVAAQLPPHMPEQMLTSIKRETRRNANFPRIVNRDMRPALQNASVGAPGGRGSCMVISGVPYGVDNLRQFQTPVYAIFCGHEILTARDEAAERTLIAEFLEGNQTLQGFIGQRVNRVREIARFHVPGLDEGFNLAILADRAAQLQPHELSAIRTGYGRVKLSQLHMQYDQLLYPLIFWSGTGGCGVDEGESIQGATGRIRKVAIALVMQPKEHFIHRMPTLREEFICAISGRLINLSIKFLIRAQKVLAREDELRRGEESEEPREYGLRNFVPPSVIDSDEYWHSVATKCFAISSELGSPTFFLTFTMNPHWHDYVALRREDATFGDSAMIAMVFKQRLSGLMKMLRMSKLLGSILGFVWRVEYQKRGLPHAHILLWTDFDTADLASVDAVINVRYPLPSPFIGDDQKSADFVQLIQSYQVHRHSARCETPEGRCRYGYPLPAQPHTIVQRRRFVFARDEDSRDVVPHNLYLLSQFRCHHCLEVIHSEQAIGYVMKYCTKNSDDGTVGAGRVLYEGVQVQEQQNLQYYAATRVASAAESFAAICGFWRHHMRPTVITLGFHLEDKKIVMAGAGQDPEDRVNLPSQLERYFGRPGSEACEGLKYSEYYSRYVLQGRPARAEDLPDTCQPVQFACQRQRRALCILRSVLPHQREKFALRLLLRHFPARHWRDLLLQNGTQFGSLYDAAREAGLVGDINREAQICMQEARNMNRAPSEMRFLLVLLARDGADIGSLLERFYEALRDEEDSIEDVRVKIDRLMASFADVYVYAHELADAVNEEMRPGLNDEQELVCQGILGAIEDPNSRLMFLQGAAGTGKTFTVRRLIELLHAQGKRCLISATTGIAAVQYPGGTTLHSLFKMGIDEVNRGPFVSPIGRRTPHAIHILRADLIIVDEVSMLTPWVANKVSKILQWIGDEALEFGGMKFLFVGDLLQLPPVVPGFAMPVVQRLITRLRCWPDIRKFRLGRPMRARDPHWNELLEILAKGEQDSLPTWTGLRQFGVTVTGDTEAAFRFFCAGVVAAQPFPLDRQWISPTNRLATEINRKVHEWRRSGGARVLGICHARSELSEPVRPGHGLSLQHQMDYIEDVDLPDLPPSQLELLEGDALMLLRNINTRAGLAKGKRCRAQDMGLMTVVVRFENGQECTFGRVRMEKTLDGVTFVRCQVPFRKVYAGTVHRAQGRTLSRVVIDCRTKWWEHGQVYVGFSRVTSPRDLCVLIPEERHADRIEAVVDRDVVNIVEAIGREAGQAGGRAAAPEGAQDPDADALYPSAVEGDPPRPDPEGLGYAESDADFAHDDGQMTDLHESSSAEDSE